MVAPCSMRDDVRPRRHDFAHHRFAEISEVAQQLARLAVLHGLVLRPRHRRALVGRRRRLLRGVGSDAGQLRRRSARAQPQQRDGQRPQCLRRSRRTTAAARRARARDLPDNQQRDEVLAASTMPMTDRTRTGKPAGSTPVTRARSAVARTSRDDQQARRNEQAARIFEIPPERIVAIAALGMNAQRQPHQRVERR